LKINYKKFYLIASISLSYIEILELNLILSLFGKPDRFKAHRKLSNSIETAELTIGANSNLPPKNGVDGLVDPFQ